MLKHTLHELRTHAPFTIFGAITGVAVLYFFRGLSADFSYKVFYILHPLHVVLSALATTSMYKLHKCKQVGKDCLTGKCNFLMLLAIGYIGSIGVATLSDSIIPYLAETLLDLPDREMHLGFIEEWWLVNPLAVLGIVIANYRPSTEVPHAGHVLLSTWASLFHVLMAVGAYSVGLFDLLAILVFLFVAVWIPCCLSDIVFPLFFVKDVD